MKRFVVAVPLLFALLLALGVPSGAGEPVRAEATFTGWVLELEAGLADVSRVVLWRPSDGKKFEATVTERGHQTLLETALAACLPVEVKRIDDVLVALKLRRVGSLSSAGMPRPSCAAGSGIFASRIQVIRGIVTAEGEAVAGGQFTVRRTAKGTYGVIVRKPFVGSLHAHCVPLASDDVKVGVKTLGQKLVRLDLKDAKGDPVDASFEFALVGATAPWAARSVPVMRPLSVACNWPTVPGDPRSPEDHLFDLHARAIDAQAAGFMDPATLLLIEGEVIRLLFLDPATQVCPKAWQWPHWKLMAVWGKAVLAKEATADPMVAHAEWSRVAEDLGTIPDDTTVWLAGIPVPPGPRPCQWPSTALKFEKPIDLLQRVHDQAGAAHTNGVIDAALKNDIQARALACMATDLETADDKPVCHPDVWEAPYARLVGIWGKAVFAEVLMPDTPQGLATQLAQWHQIHEALNVFPDPQPNLPPGD